MKYYTITAAESRIAELEAALRTASGYLSRYLIERDPQQDVEVSAFLVAISAYSGVTALETPDDAWLCVCGLTVKKRYQCLCGGIEDNSRADRFTSDRASKP